MRADAAISSLPEGRVVPLRAVRLAYRPEPHPFHLANAERARRNWRREKALRPKLFDGKVALASAIALDDGTFAAECHLVPFSTFLLWRRERPVIGAFHVFAMPLLVTSDGALIVVRMARHTANAGRIYAPSGSFDAADLSGGGFDIAGNIRREVAEETGLDLAMAMQLGGDAVLIQNTIVTLGREFRLAFSAAQILARIDAHIAAQDDPEIDAAFVLRRPGDIDGRYAEHMAPFIDWHFGLRNPGNGR